MKLRPNYEKGKPLSKVEW